MKKLLVIIGLFFTLSLGISSCEVEAYPGVSYGYGYGHPYYWRHPHGWYGGHGYGYREHHRGYRGGRRR